MSDIYKNSHPLYPCGRERCHIFYSARWFAFYGGVYGDNSSSGAHLLNLSAESVAVSGASPKLKRWMIYWSISWTYSLRSERLPTFL